MTRRAVILAGGLGERLRPYTTTIPKPLMPVGDRPILDIVLRQLKHHGFRDITIATGYLAELIEAFVRDGREYEVKVDYFREHDPLGTVGALAEISGLDEPFLVMNGDVLTDLDYRGLMDSHTASGAAATIATQTRDVQVSLGVLEFDEDDPDRLTGYVEKPKLHYECSMGVYCFDPSVVPHIEPGVRLDFPDLILRLIAEGKEVRAVRSDAYWMDIGRHDDYSQVQDEFEAVRDKLLPQE